MEKGQRSGLFISSQAYNSVIAMQQYNRELQAARQEAGSHATEYLKGYLASYESHASGITRFLENIGILMAKPKIAGFREVLEYRLRTEKWYIGNQD
jgi:hypothetical protein